MTLAVCPSCGGDAVTPVFRLDAAPVLCNQLWPNREAAKAAPVGTVDLNICDTCGLIWNRAFDPAKMVYSVGYENALHFSREFRVFASDLAQDLIEENDLAGKSVVEVGAGDGFFLETMVSNGVSRAVGYDPSLPEVKELADGRVRLVPEAFHPGQLKDPFAAILCRHVVEHLTDPLDVLTEMRRALSGTEASVYVEVPNAGWMLRSTSIWDVIYEHVTYWTAPSMAALFDRAGLSVTRSDELYNQQFLGVRGTEQSGPAVPDPAALDAVRADAAHFGDAADRLVADWKAFFGSVSGRSVIWGAGSKGITLANVIGGEDAGLVALVDQNPRKHGKFIPGAGLPVVAPDDLATIKPDCVVISNGLYLDEIQSQLSALGVEAPVRVLAS